MKILLLILVWVICAVSSVSFAFAETKSFELDQSKFLLQTSASKEIVETLIIKNLSDQIIDVGVSWEGYPNSSQHSVDFASLSTKNLTIQPFAIGSVEVKFTSPATLKPGDFYGKALVKSNDNLAEANFTLRYLGELKENIQIQKIEVSGNKIILKLKNDGNVSTTVGGDLSLTNFFGQSILDQNIDQFEIKAKEEKVFSNVVKSLPGPYQTKVSLSVGEKNTSLTSVQTVWLWPVFFWITIACIPILVVGLLIISLRLRKTHV